MDTPAAADAVPFYAGGKRSRDLAAERGICEAERLAAHRVPEAMRLRAEPKAFAISPRWRTCTHSSRS